MAHGSSMGKKEKKEGHKSWKANNNKKRRDQKGNNNNKHS